MKIIKKNRNFSVKKIKLKHVANIYLKNNNFVTFKEGNNEIDFTKKDWGYYPFPSINSRLKRNFYRIVLVENTVDKKIFILVVKKNKIKTFKKYIKKNSSKVITWFDDKKFEKFLKKIV